jgi:Cu+-exporting ATPase
MDRVAERTGAVVQDEATPRLVSVVALDGRDERALLALAAGVARGLDAPLATAVLESARDRDARIVEADSLQETTGAGVAASITGRMVVLGNAALFAQIGISLEGLGDWPERLRRHGQHVLFVAVERRTVGLLGLLDGRRTSTQTHERDGGEDA